MGRHRDAVATVMKRSSIYLWDMTPYQFNRHIRGVEELINSSTKTEKEEERR